MKRSARLRVIAAQAQADHVLEQRIGGDDYPSLVRRDKTGKVTRDKQGRINITEPRTPRFPSREIEADADRDVEPLELADLELDDPRRRDWLAYRAACVLAGTAPEPIATPRTRAQCPADRHDVGCGAYRCRFSLARNDAPAGRPGLSSVPRDSRGWTLKVIGPLGDRAGSNPPRLEPLWLRGGRCPTYCALDVVDQRGPIIAEEIGELMSYEHRHRTLVSRVVVGAVKALEAKGESVESLMRLVDPHEAQQREHAASRARGTARATRGIRCRP